jgi:hypothetical protein
VGALDHTSGGTPDVDRETGLEGRADEWSADGGAGGYEAFDDPVAFDHPTDMHTPPSAGEALGGKAGDGEPSDEVRPPPAEQQPPAEILQPNDEPIGQPGTSPGIRELPGSEAEAENLYGRLSAGGEEVQPPGYPGRAVELPDGGFVGLRLESKSGGPAIDVNIPGIEITRIHFR